MPRPALLALLVLSVAWTSLSTGCARSRAARPAEPISPARAWVSPLHRDHPLVGRVWDVRGERFVEEAELAAAVGQARYVLLGETHDNADHHLLQGRLVRAVIEAGRAPVVAFEMLSIEQQGDIDAALARSRSPDRLARAVRWDESGWPAFALYRPIFAAALEAGLPIAGANLPRTRIREIVAKGEAVLPEALRERIRRRGAISPEEMAQLREEMNASHCGEFPEVLLAPMVLGQKARDAQMAETLSAAPEGGAVLIAGAEHVRQDRGVPAFLHDAKGTILAVAFREVSPDLREPVDYAREDRVSALPYDFVIFTPALKREDPCEALRAQLRAREAAKAERLAEDADPPDPAP